MLLDFRNQLGERLEMPLQHDIAFLQEPAEPGKHFALEPALLVADGLQRLLLILKLLLNDWQMACKELDIRSLDEAVFKN